MDLESLQRKGVIHIGLRKSAAILYAYRMPSNPSHIALGAAFEGTILIDGVPGVPEVLDAYRDAPEQPQFIMICHHSSASEIVQKIGAALDGNRRDGPGSDAWFEASLDELIYAYPPFAKIFLSEVPDAVKADDPRSLNRDSTGGSSEQGSTTGVTFGGKAGGETDEKAETWTDVVLLRTEQSKTAVSLVLILGMVLATGYFGLESIRNGGKGGSVLERIEDFTGLSFGKKGGSQIGSNGEASGRSKDETGQEIPLDFAGWYSPTRGGDTGVTFGLPREVKGFSVKTWTSGPEDYRRLLAAYRYSGDVSYQHRSEAEREMSKKLLRDLIDTDTVLSEVGERSCSVVFGPKSERLTNDEFGYVEVLVVHEDIVLRSLEMSQDDCATK
jgi:hypothetical protein